MELLKIDEHFLVTDYVSNGSFASLKENVEYKYELDYAILVRITDFVKNWNGKYVYINEEEYNFLEKSKIFPGDLIVSNVGQPGLSFILPDLGIQTSLAPNSIVVRPKSNRVNNEYLNYYLGTVEGQNLIDSICTKTTLKKFNKTSFRNLLIPFPSYADQIRIARLLEKIESLVAERKRSIELLEELVKAAFYQLFGDPFKIPLSALISLEEVSMQITDGEHATPVRTDKGIKLLSARNIQNGYLDFSKGVDYIDQNEYERISKRCKPEINDILMSCSGTIGRVAVVNLNEPFSLVRSVALIKPKNDVLNSYFLMHWLQSAFLQNEINKNSKKSSQANIFTGAIKKLPVYIPDFDLQNQFAGIAQKIEALKSEQQAQVQVMEELYAALTQKAFAGSLDLSRIPVDDALLPAATPLTRPADEQEQDDDDDGEEEKEEGDDERNAIIEKAPGPRKDKTAETGTAKEMTQLGSPLSWDTVSFKEVATYISQHFGTHYFNTEMLLRYLEEDLGIQVHYFTSAEQKKNPQYEQADDFLSFVAGALTGQNTFLGLEQVFYNAETENIPDISFTPNDLETLAGKTQKERSGIYFCIKDETTPG